MWRWGLIILLPLVSHAGAIGILVAFGVPACLLVDANIRQRRPATQ